MNRVTSIVEKALFFIIFLALIGKARHLGSSGMILILSMMLLSILYFPMGFFTLGPKDAPSKANFIAVWAGLTLSLATFGIMFKFMIWPGANTPLYLGLTGTFVFILLYVLSLLNIYKAHEAFFAKNIFRLSVFFAACFLMIFLPTETRVRLQYPGSPEAFIRLRTAYEEHPEVDSIQNAYFNYGKHVDSIMQKATMRRVKASNK